MTRKKKPTKKATKKLEKEEQSVIITTVRKRLHAKKRKPHPSTVKQTIMEDGSQGVHQKPGKDEIGYYGGKRFRSDKLKRISITGRSLENFVKLENELRTSVREITTVEVPGEDKDDDPKVQVKERTVKGDNADQQLDVETQEETPNN
jgi:hypothetical protein